MDEWKLILKEKWIDGWMDGWIVLLSIWRSWMDREVDDLRMN
jgi:hypothetical protein